MRFLYTTVFYLAVPLILARLWWRARRAPAYRRRWRERFGWVPLNETADEVIWLHAVSVGETIAAAPLVKALQQRYPAARIVVTTTTPTGSERVGALFGDSAGHCYAPYDLPGSVRRFLQRVRPCLLVVMETELWPNTIAQCARRGIPVVLANARLSAKSAQGYARFSGLTKPMLQRLDAVAAQHEADARRFIELGLPPEKCHITGNIKFDLTLGDELRARARALKDACNRNARRIVWIAASTHRGEDEIILDVFKRVQESVASLLLILVPRHPERFDDVAERCRAAGHSVQRRSRGEKMALATEILLGDTMGELLLLYGAADFAFVGGSLVPVGGHNLMEPAAWRLPIITGEHLFNFAEASNLLLSAGGMVKTSSPAMLAKAVTDLAQDEELRCLMGQKALAVAQSNRGALDKLIDLIETVIARNRKSEPD